MKKVKRLSKEEKKDSRKRNQFNNINLQLLIIYSTIIVIKNVYVEMSVAIYTYIITEIKMNESSKVDKILHFGEFCHKYTRVIDSRSSFFDKLLSRNRGTVITT